MPSSPRYTYNVSQCNNLQIIWPPFLFERRFPVRLFIAISTQELNSHTSASKKSIRNCCIFSSVDRIFASYHHSVERFDTAHSFPRRELDKFMKQISCNGGVNSHVELDGVIHI